MIDMYLSAINTYPYHLTDYIYKELMKTFVVPRLLGQHLFAEYWILGKLEWWVFFCIQDGAFVSRKRISNYSM